MIFFLNLFSKVSHVFFNKIKTYIPIAILFFNILAPIFSDANNNNFSTRQIKLNKNQAIIQAWIDSYMTSTEPKDAFESIQETALQKMNEGDLLAPLANENVKINTHGAKFEFKPDSLLEAVLFLGELASLHQRSAVESWSQYDSSKLDPISLQGKLRMEEKHSQILALQQNIEKTFPNEVQKANEKIWSLICSKEYFKPDTECEKYKNILAQKSLAYKAGLEDPNNHKCKWQKLTFLKQLILKNEGYQSIIIDVSDNSKPGNSTLIDQRQQMQDAHCSQIHISWIKNTSIVTNLSSKFTQQSKIQKTNIDWQNLDSNYVVDDTNEIRPVTKEDFIQFANFIH